MKKNKFMESGHFPTLIAAFLYFDVSFMVWVMLGPLAPFLSEMLKLTPYQKGLLTAIPLLGGALFRPVLGFLGERFGERRTGLLGLAFTLLPLILGWRFAHTAAQFYFLGLLLGIGGASFAVALPIAGRWYPPEYQGLVMGIAGAGNSGTLIATLFAPRLAQKFGWANTFALAMLPVMVVLLLFALLAKDSPRRSEPPKWKAIAAILREPDTAWFCFFYSFTFGGFVGMASFSAPAAAIPRTRWDSHRIGRCGWRLGRLLFAFSSRRHQAANRAVFRRAFSFRRCFPCGCLDLVAARYQMARELARRIGRPS